MQHIAPGAVVALLLVFIGWFLWTGRLTRVRRKTLPKIRRSRGAIRLRTVLEYRRTVLSMPVDREPIRLVLYVATWASFAPDGQLVDAAREHILDSLFGDLHRYPAEDGAFYQALGFVDVSETGHAPTLDELFPFSSFGDGEKSLRVEADGTIRDLSAMREGAR